MKRTIYTGDNYKDIKTKKRSMQWRKARRRRRNKKIIVSVVVLTIILIINGWGGPAEMIEDALQKYSTEELINKGYPESLAELYMRNSETKEFVLGFKDYNGNPGNIDVSEEMKEGGIPHFLQWDSRWGYEIYGDDYMAVTGCGPTALSMVHCGLTGDSSMHPLKMAQLADEKGYYVDGSGSSWSMMTGLAESIGLTVWKPSFNAGSIINELRNGNPIICIMGPGDFTTTGHFIVLAGVTEDDKIIVHDPNSRRNSEKLWDVETIMSQTRDLWAYS